MFAIPDEEEEGDRLKELLDGYKESLQNSSFAEAVINLSEILESQIPLTTRDKVILHNNRSAMYEKLGNIELALSDNSSVLTLDNTHIKARKRLARICESQGKLDDALANYVHALIIEQSKGTVSTNQEQLIVDNLARVVGKAKAAPLITEMRLCQGKDIPNNFICRTFMESFPLIFRCRQNFQHLSSMCANEQIQQILEKITSNLVSNKFADAFAAVSSLCAEYEDPESEAHQRVSAALASVLYDLQGTEYSLRVDFVHAIITLKRALSLDPANSEAAIKLANILLDLGDVSEAALIYKCNIVFEDVCPSSPARSVDKSWALLHRASLWTVKNEQGKLEEGGLDRTISDLKECLGIVAQEVQCASDLAATQAHFNALLKLIQIQTEVKPQLEIALTEAETTECQQHMEKVMLLLPKHDAVVMMEVNSLCQQYRHSEALAMIAAATREADPCSAMPVVLKANVLSHQLMACMYEGDADRAEMLKMQVTTLYTTALSLDQQQLDHAPLLLPFAQFKSMFGDNAGAMILLEQALTHARTCEDIESICQMFVMANAQCLAMASQTS